MSTSWRGMASTRKVRALFNLACGNEEDHVTHHWWVDYGDMGDVEYDCPGGGIFKL